ncbi:FAD-dependent oxidoreductase [Nocardioides sp.]|uniref:NAD(P)/FAD-dependent oxidoreductase n=1 Tax=Nocardioides sp. TaxID=35761 RepID=UPI0025D99391|nr:FAD-dependent oxidoreductase [Nocardioides sp.]
MSRSDDVLIVGAGQAAAQLACSLREAGHQGSITLVGDEPAPPYQRPPLSKGFLTGAADEDSLALRAPGYWQANGIDLLLGETVVEVDRGAGAGGRALTASGRELVFDRLVLATGAAPRRLDVPGAQADGVVVLRTLADAADLRRRLATARDVVVVGGGFVGLEVAATATVLGARVTVLEAGPRILGRAVSEATSRYLTDHHRATGIAVHTDVSVTEIVSAGAGRVVAVRTADREIPADLVLVGVGADPRCELAERLGLQVDDGIVVDEHLLASDGTTIAIGDCAVAVDPTPWADLDASAPCRVRLESVDHAVTQAASAVRTVLGEPSPHVSVPWFWSDQGTAKLQIVGLRRPGDRATVRPAGPGRLVVGFHRAGRLVAAEVVGSPADFMALRTLLGAGHPVPADVFADGDVVLRQLAKDARQGSISAC